MEQWKTDGIPLQFFNTESRQLEVFKPLNKRDVLIYTCGPTVYDYAHIGNFRTYVFEDLLRRTLKFFGYHVTQVMNLTDVDDKTIRGAVAKNISLGEFTKTFVDAFFDDLKTLNIEKVEHYPAATDYIQPMIDVIHVLLEKGMAYKGGDGSIYYPIRKFSRYGCLSHLHLDELQAGASDRVASDEYEKDNVADFVLWKAYDPTRDGHIFWESPFGKGRPGWHLECSTMAMKLLGETIDIHVGGIDNMFPHHENEIAQSEAYSGKQFVKHWMHSEHLIVNNKKMSKSLGNFFTLRDLLSKGFKGDQIRYMLLHTHYKTQLNFTFEGLDGARSALQRINALIERLQEITSLTSIEKDDVSPLLDRTFIQFATALGDDLNISVALAALFDMLREINLLADQGKVNQALAQKTLLLLKRFDDVLGIMTFEKKAETIPGHIQEAFDQRLKARKDKNWALADSLRDVIHQGGYMIEDTPAGARLKKAETSSTPTK